MNKYITLVALLVSVLLGSDAVAAHATKTRSYRAKVGVNHSAGKSKRKGKSVAGDYGAKPKKGSRGIASLKKKAKRHPRQRHQ